MFYIQALHMNCRNVINEIYFHILRDLWEHLHIFSKNLLKLLQIIISKQPRYCQIVCLITGILLLYSKYMASGLGPPSYRGFTIALRHTELGRTPLDEWSTCRKALYLTKHNNHVMQHPCPRRNANPQSQQTSFKPHGNWSAHGANIVGHYVVLLSCRFTNFPHYLSLRFC